jgi:hypothetical protein
VKITELTNDDPDFYPVLGPYLARRAVHKQVGDTIWDDDGKTWLIARTRNGTVAGFCGVITRGKKTLLESLYVTDEEDTTTAAALITRATKNFGHDRHLEVIVRHALVPAHTAAGFTVTQELKNFTKMIRPATITRDNP